MKFSQEHVQIKIGQVMKLNKEYMFLCLNLTNTGIIKPNMIPCVSKLTWLTAPPNLHQQTKPDWQQKACEANLRTDSDSDSDSHLEYLIENCPHRK